MNNLYVLLVSSVLFVLLVNAEMYKHTDADGVTTYSDVQETGAKEIQTPQGNTITLPKYMSKQTPTPKKKQDAYNQFSITSPNNDETIRESSGNILVKLLLSPSLKTKDGHSITLYVDNQVFLSNITMLSVNLSSIDRGSHTIHATVNDSSDQTFIQSNVITIHLKRFSKLH